MRRSRRLPFVSLLLLLAAGAASYVYEHQVGRPAMAWMGLPEGVAGAATWTRVFRNEGFMLGWSDRRGNPLWVSYRLTPLSPDAPRLKRPDRFEADWRALGLVDHGSYARSGYTRGHMAPNHAVSRLYGAGAQQETFLMTNVSPQKAELNSGVWETLEQIELDVFTEQFGTVWVITGPIFDGEVQRLSSMPLVEIPDAFYKIYAVPDADGEPRLLAFVIPQDVDRRAPPAQFITSVDEVEALTGLDFFSSLDDTTESRVEARADARGFDLAAPRRRR